MKQWSPGGVLVRRQEAPAPLRPPPPLGQVQVHPAPLTHRCITPHHPLPADEIDAIGTKRYDSHSGGEREIQRTMLELLNQMDGFDALSEVKVRQALQQCGT